MLVLLVFISTFKDVPRVCKDLDHMRLRFGDFLEILGYCNLFALFCYNYNSDRFVNCQLSVNFTVPLIGPPSFQRIYFLFSSALNDIQR